MASVPEDEDDGEDTYRSPVIEFPSESLHSFSYSSKDLITTEARKDVLGHSLDFMRLKASLAPVQEKPLPSIPSEGDLSVPINKTTLHNKDTPKKDTKTLTSVEKKSFKNDTAPLGSVTSPLKYSSLGEDGEVPESPKRQKPLSQLSINTKSVPTKDISKIASDALSPLSTTPTAVPLHSPTRFSPTHQAMATTDEDGKILVANDLFCLMLQVNREKLLGWCVLDIFPEPYRTKENYALNESKQSPRAGEKVLQCGRIVRDQHRVRCSSQTCVLLHL